MRSKIKRIVSLLCVLTVLVSGVPFGDYLQKVEAETASETSFSEDFDDNQFIDAIKTDGSYWTDAQPDDPFLVLNNGGYISGGTELKTNEHSFKFFMYQHDNAAGKLSMQMGGNANLNLYFKAITKTKGSLYFNDQLLGDSILDIGSWYTAKLLRLGDRLSIKIWKSSEEEPAEYTYTVTDPLFVGTYGLKVTSSENSARFDNFSGWAIDANPENQGEQPNPEFRKRSFFSFGIEDGEYTKESMFGTSKATQGSINWDGTVIYGDFKMPAEGGTYFNLGGKNSPWYGLVFNTTSDGKMSLRLIDENRNEPLAEFDPNVAGQLLGDWVKMMISSEFVDADGDGVENDVKLGIWFNEVLYNQTYITIKDYAENLGGMALIGLNNAAAKVEINSYPEYKGDDKIIIDNTEQPNPAFRKRGFSSFGIKDGDYSYESMSGKSKSSKGGINWDGTVIYGDIKMPATGGTYINLGGKTSPWFGLVLTTGTGGSLILRLIDTDENRNESLAAFYPYQAGTTLLGEWVQLMISSEFVDADGDGVKNDVKLGIWFNEVLYNGTYITIKDYAHRLGGRALIGLSDEAATVSIRSYPEYKGNDKTITEQPNASFTKKTFASFGIKDGQYTHENTSGKMVVNKARFSLDKTVIRGDFLITEGSRTYLYFGGKSNPWYGIVFIPASDGRMSLTLIDGERKQWLSTLDPEIAGTKLFGEWVDFMMSTEFIDADGDGNINDVKLGLWFNEVLYDDKYIIIKDYADKMGGMLNFYCEKPGSSISLRSNMNYYTKERFDYESFGLTDKWRSTLFGSQNAYTGDTTNIVCWSIVAGVALVGLLLYGVTQKKKKGRMNL